MNRILSIEELDMLQRKTAKGIQDSLKIMNSKSTVECIGIGYEDVERSLDIYVYKDKYNYRHISYIFNPSIPVEAYCNGISSDIATGNYKEYNASPEEIYVTEIIDATGCKHLFILDRELRSENSVDTVDLTSIESLNYSKSESTLRFIEDSGEKLMVDLANETITWIEKDEELVPIEDGDIPV